MMVSSFRRDYTTAVNDAIRRTETGKVISTVLFFWKQIVLPSHWM